jgi:hypothetical protein
MSSHFKLGELRQHAVHVVDALLAGRLVPFLGAGINLCDRPANLAWSPSDKNHLPKGAELAEYLANEFHYPGRQVCPRSDCPIHLKQDLDLARVAQHVVMVRDGGPLNDAIRDCFGGDFPPTSAHRFLANLASRPAPKARNPERKFPLIVTTNYDDLMERALEIAGQPYDLVYFHPGGPPLPAFWHRPPGQIAFQIRSANDYPYAFCESRPTILKIHGTVDRTVDDGGAFVITEDQYIEYLAQQPLESLLPPRLLFKMRANHLWFLGYSLRDWNLRVFLYKLKTRNPQENYRSWAVLLNSNETETKFWFRNDVEIVDAPLNKYLDELGTALAGAAFL